MPNKQGFPKVHLLEFYCRGCAARLSIQRNRDAVGRCPHCNETYRPIKDALMGWMVQPVKIVSR